MKKLDVREILKRVGNIIGSQKNFDIASALGVDQNVCSNWKRRQTIPWSELYAFAQKSKITMDWLLTGERPGPHVPPQAGDFDVIHKYKARLTGAPGSLEKKDEIDACFMFRKKWIQRKGDPKNMAFFDVVGDSMYPTICDGDIVLCDLTQNNLKEIRSGKIYVFTEGDMVKVKRLTWQGERLKVTSDNRIADPDYPADMGSFCLMGRVIWVGHEVL